MSAPQLPVSNLVNVTINLTPLGASVRTFGVLLACGDSNVISGLERIRTYTSLNQVADDFGLTAPEYLAAQLYFGQSPQPQIMMIGRWLRTASAAQLDGGLLSSSAQNISNFNYISSGGFHITVDGTVKSLASLDFTSDTNLNMVAATIQTALTGATIVWNGSQFVVTSNTQGAGSHASGSVTLTGNPANNDTLDVNGTTITFKTASPSGNQVLIGATPNDTANNLIAFLDASSDSNITASEYSLSGLIITVTAAAIGTGGNAITLAKSGTNITVSGATLSGGVNASSVSFATAPGSGTDISGLLALTSAFAIVDIPGYSAESPVQCAAVMADLSPEWYGLMFAASVEPTDDQNIAVSGFIEGQDLTRVFGVTIINTNVLSNLVTSDLASRMKAGSYNQSCCQYSENPYAIASLMGRAFSVNFEGNSTTITLMYKQEPEVVAENLTVSQAATLQSKNCNVFVQYVNDTSIIQYGVMSSGEFFDTIQGVDWLQNEIQTNVYNLLYTSTTKVPQTDAGVNQVVNAISAACQQAAANGLVAPGIWNASGFGQLQMGQYLSTGYYIYATPLALQSESDRAARKAPPIQVAVKLAGAIQTVNVLLNVNQ